MPFLFINQKLLDVIFYRQLWLLNAIKKLKCPIKENCNNMLVQNLMFANVAKFTIDEFIN